MRLLLGQVSRFAVVGVAATAVHYLVIVLLVDGLAWTGPTPATVVGSVFGIATAYLGNALFVFAAIERRHAVHAPRFVVVYLTVMAIHAGMMYLFADLLGLPYTLGFVVATGFSALTTFLANRYLVFTGAHDAGQSA